MFWFLPCFVRVFFLPWIEIGRVRGRVYNTRYTIVPTWLARVFGKHAVFLHHFQSDDATRDFHNHPYEESNAYLLAGGYWEERAYFESPKRHPTKARLLCVSWLDFKAGDRNRIFSNTFHRIELTDKKRGCWTLFVAGKKVQPWGFWNRNTGVFTRWSGEDPGKLYIDPRPADERDTTPPEAA